MRRRRRVLVAVLLLGAVLLASCSNTSAQPAKDALAHFKAAVVEHTQSDQAVDGIGKVDMTSLDACLTVSRIASETVRHATKAREALNLARASVASIADAEVKAKWTKLLDEYDQALASHEEISKFGLNLARQLTVTGLCESQIPASIGDQRGAWAWAELDPKFASMRALGAKVAVSNFNWLAAELDAAHQLEPKAALDLERDFCLKQVEISKVLLAACKAGEAGRGTKAASLMKQARKLRAVAGTFDPSEMAIFSGDYVAPVTEMSATEDQHIAAATAILAELDTASK